MRQFNTTTSPSERHRGATLVEYLIIGGLLVTIAITTFLYFGQAFNSSMVALKKDMGLHTSQSAIVQTSANVESAKTSNLPSTTSQTFSFDENGAVVTSSVATQTVGSNGDLYGNHAHQQQKPPPSGPNLSPEEQALIKNLSNSEHYAANLERSLQQVANYSGNDIEKFKNTTILVNGKPMTTEQILLCLKFSGIFINIQNIMVQNSSINDDTASYVNQQASNVQSQTQQVSSATDNTLNNNGTPNTVGDTAKPSDTHQSASNTCTAGGYTDGGGSCASSIQGPQ